MARLYIVRHGNTFDPGETVRRVGGRTDLALSGSGRAQAAALAAQFSAIAFTAALASPLARTRETARAILARQHGAPALRLAPALREIDYGPDEDQPESAVVARIGAAALTAWEAHGEPPPGWLVDPEAIRANWRRLLDRAGALAASANVLIVTSNGIARFLPESVSEAPDGLDPKLRTGAWGEVVVTGERATIAAWNARP